MLNCSTLSYVSFDYHPRYSRSRHLHRCMHCNRYLFCRQVGKVFFLSFLKDQSSSSRSSATTVVSSGNAPATYPQSGYTQQSFAKEEPQVPAYSPEPQGENPPPPPYVPLT